MAGLFGIRKYGVDINGYVMDPVKGLSIWLQKRSPNKQTWPAYWDSMVSGGLTVGYGINETAIKEAFEEAGIPNNLIAKLKSAGCVSFFFESERGLFPNTEFVYDLELPPDFIPSNSDGEVETFELLPVSECLERILSPHFKTTSVPVALDFLIRHGYITAENGKASFFFFIVSRVSISLSPLSLSPENLHAKNCRAITGEHRVTLICPYTFVAEPNFIQIVELLHVPLQTMYNFPHKACKITANGEANYGEAL